MREACGCGWVKGAALSTAILCCQGRCGKADLAAGMNVESRGKKQAARRSLTDWCKAGPFVVLDANAAPPLRAGVSGEVAVSRREAGAQTRWVRSSEQNTTHNTPHTPPSEGPTSVHILWVSRRRALPSGGRRTAPVCFRALQLEHHGGVSSLGARVRRVPDRADGGLCILGKPSSIRHIIKEHHSIKDDQRAISIEPALTPL